MSADVALAAYCSGHISAEVALARLLLAGWPPDEIGARLSGRGEARIALLRELAARRGDALRRLSAMFSALDHESRPDGAVTPAHIAEMFDRAAAAAPEASVASYSLGDPSILARATSEILDWLDAERLIGPRSDVLDLGCGIGRVAAALAGRVASVLGTDVSTAMIQLARERCRAPNVRFQQVDGSGLGAIPDAAIDLVLAVDSFPYLVQVGVELAARHVAEAARVLRPGGALAILNLSYRAEPDADPRDAAAWADRCGMRLRLAGATPFGLWDGRAFVLDRV